MVWTSPIVMTRISESEQVTFVCVAQVLLYRSLLAVSSQIPRTLCCLFKTICESRNIAPVSARCRLAANSPQPAASAYHIIATSASRQLAGAGWQSLANEALNGNDRNTNNMHHHHHPHNMNINNNTHENADD